VGIIDEMRPARAKKKVKMKLQRWRDIEEFAEFLEEEKGVVNPERDVVLEGVIRRFFHSKRKVAQKFEDWKGGE
jgi:hypothetical protein